MQKNSVFAEPLIKTLKNNNNVIRSYELFKYVQSYVIDNANQTPNHSTIHGTGHDGGEFLFFLNLKKDFQIYPTHHPHYNHEL